MLNTITTIKERKVWVTICHLEAGKRYRISYVPTEIARIELHLHSSSGEHRLAFSRPGTSAIGGFTYKHSLSPRESGDLVMRTNAGWVENIVVEEIA